MWFREGLSSYLAEEGNDHVSFMQQWRLAGKEVLWGPDEMLRFIHPLVDREQGRIARYNAFLMIWNLSETYGFARVQQLLDLVENGALSLAGLITHQAAAKDAPSAYRTAFDDPACLKMILNWEHAA